MRRLVAAYRRPAGKHRATAPWPPTVPAVDPWEGQPLFHPTGELIAQASTRVTCGRALTNRGTR